MAKIEITSDCLDISNRLKSIDNSYYIVFDTKKQKYEVHSKDQVLESYCFTSPYNSLDERLIYFALKTRSQNKDNLLKELEKENQKFIKDQQNKQKEKIFKQLEDMGEI